MRGKSFLKKKINKRKKRTGKMNNRGGTRSAAIKSKAKRKRMSPLNLGVL